MKYDRNRQLTKFERYSLISLTIFLVGSLIDWLSPQSIFALLKDLGIALMIPVLTGYGIKLFRWLKAKLLFSVRNKILISYIFIGGVPLSLLLIVFSIVIVLMFKQISGIFLQNELNDISDILDDINTRIMLSIHEEDLPLQNLSMEIPAEIREALEQAPESMREIESRIYHPVTMEEQGKMELAATISRNSRTEAGRGEKEYAPQWLGSNFSGFIRDDGILYLSDIKKTSENLILLTQVEMSESLIVQLENNTYYDVEIVKATEQGFSENFGDIYRRLSEQSSIFSVLGVHFIRPIEWESGSASTANPILISAPIKILFIQLFSQISQVIMILLYSLAGIYLLTVVLSILAGAKIARGITSSINDIYQASELVQKGEFDFRIAAGRDDQLEVMANSFNELSSGIMHLMSEVSKRERLEKELEIAREVQFQLLPREIPKCKALHLSASCLPALGVGGDYYDFIQNPGSVDLVIGDIAGKGISAALLMASTLATIHHTLNEKTHQDQVERLIAVAEEVNSQIFIRSAANAYSTLFIASFEEETRHLTYCNAGHQPPIHISRGEARELNAGGTAIGLFSQWEFTAETVKLESGDTVVFFTDGVVEASNFEEELYGNDRLLELIVNNLSEDPDTLREKIIESVMDWSGESTQGDDITIICLKVI